MSALGLLSGFDGYGRRVAAAIRVLNQRASRQLLTIPSRTRASVSCLPLQGLATAPKVRSRHSAIWNAKGVDTLACKNSVLMQYKWSIHSYSTMVGSEIENHRERPRL